MISMTTKERMLFWVIIFSVLGFFLTRVHNILLPFVVATATAYFLNPAVEKLEKYGLGRIAATMVIIGSFFILIILAATLLIPELYHQLLDLGHKIPEYTSYAKTVLIPKIAKNAVRFNPSIESDLQNMLKKFSGTLFGILGNGLEDFWQSSLAIVNLLSLLVITPVVTFHMLKNWDQVLAKINSLLPLTSAKEIRTQCKLIDNALSGYIRGQTNVCLILGLYYGFGLTLTGLQFGFVVGFMTGILTFIPYIGVFIGTAAGLGLACFQFDSTSHILAVAGVFILGQLLEGNIITPKLVGDKVGLSPIWLIFGMLSGASLFGFLGVLIAVPATAIVGVLIRFLIGKYTSSALYLGTRAA